MKKKVLFIAPHLSTGGMPQYLVKQIELIKDSCEVYCVEWGDVTGGVLVVQRNKMVKLLDDRLITLGENKHDLFEVINKIQPDVVHLQEIPELFMSSDIADKLYSTTRTYVLIETSHDSGYNTDNKVYLPDKFLMVSNYQKNAYKKFDIPCDVVEYPIENKVRTKTREQALRDLGLDPNIKHVINVGLFTPRKNQAEIIEYARMLQNYPIQFHFIGNQADNFKFYWEPLMKDFPPNCKWWNERSDVDSFYEAADLFLFTSRGHATDMETMPLVIRESLSWKTPSLIYNLPVYLGYFDEYDTIEYLTTDLQKNAYRIAEKLITDFTPQKQQQVNNPDEISNMKEIVIVSTYPNTKDKEKLLNDTVKKFKSVGKDVLITSHYPVPDYIVEKADYYIYDSKNMLDTGRTLETNGPDYWVDDAQLRVESIIVNHLSSLSRTFSVAMDFVSNLGYEYFLLTESDVIYDKNDLKRFDEIKKETLQKKRKVFFFKPLPSEFTWNGSPVYETYCYGGVLKDFLDIFKFPKDLEGWHEVIKDMGSVCIEYLLYKKFCEFENEVNVINGTIKRNLRDSKIDLYSHSGPSGVYYNLDDPLMPVLFLMNQDQDSVEFRFNNGRSGGLTIQKLNRNGWFYEILDLKNYDNLNIKLEKYVEDKLHSSTVEVLTKENIRNKKSYRTIKFKN